MTKICWRGGVSEMAKQEWVCEGCGLSGKTEYTDTDVRAVVRAIQNHHDTLAKKYSPKCRLDVYKVRVRNPELVDEFEWNRMVAKIEKDAGRPR